LLASVGIALEWAERRDATRSQVSLFGEEAAAQAVALVASREWTDAERLTNEKTALGFYLSGHPFADYAAELAPIIRTSLANLQPRSDRVLIAGIVTTLRVQTSRRGKMAFVTLDDGKGRVEILVYNETFDAATQPAARGSARRGRRSRDAADERRGRAAGHARRRGDDLRLGHHPQA
jgi:DNA polymerase-3 subunit alpha